VDGPHPGRDDHHIIEHGDQNNDIPRELIDGKQNIVRIPRYKHWEINAIYQTPCQELGGKTPREYLQGKSAEERYQFGLKVLRKVGVLK
jgi:hypothetical protein